SPRAGRRAAGRAGESTPLRRWPVDPMREVTGDRMTRNGPSGPVGPAARAAADPGGPAPRGPDAARSTAARPESRLLRHQAPLTSPRQTARARTRVDTTPPGAPNTVRRRDRRAGRKGRAAHVRSARACARTFRWTIPEMKVRSRKSEV